MQALGHILRRLKQYHIDQTYKSLVGSTLFARCRRDHIAFGVMPHRSGCCDSSRHLDQELSTYEYLPEPTIPDCSWPVPKKLELQSTDEILLSALRQKTKVRSPLNHLDVVGLRLWSYLPCDDPLLTRPDAVKIRDDMTKSLLDEKSARDCTKFATNVNDAFVGTDADSDRALTAALGQAFGAKDVEDQAALAREQMIAYCNDKALPQGSVTEWQLAAMIERGLIQHVSEPCLSCEHHSKQLWSLEAAWQHFTVANVLVVVRYDGSTSY